MCDSGFMDNNEKKDKALEHLLEHPFDYNGCAELLGFGLLEFLEFRGMFVAEFQEIEERTYSLMEHLCMLGALGLELPEKYKDFNFQHAKWILKCKKNWSETQKVQNVPAPNPIPSGKGQELLEKYFDDKGEVSDGDGVSILSETARRNLQ